MFPMMVVQSSGAAFWRLSAVFSRKFTQLTSRTPWIKGSPASPASAPANLNRPTGNPIPVALSIVMGTNVSRSSDLRSSASTRQASSKKPSGADRGDGTMSVDNKAELVAKLTPLQFHITQEAGTERPFTGKYNKFYEQGTYICVVCSQELFSSDTKYDSGCGWPAFNDVLDKGKVTLHADGSLAGGNLLLLITQPGRMRTEVRCSKCSAHMGHVFEDGPAPTRKRYCINSASIEFMPAGSERKDGPKSS